MVLPLGFMWVSITFFNVVLSLVAAMVASHKGRNALGWFLLCFFSGIFFSSLIVLIILFVLPDLREEETRVAREAAWRRRHQESFEEERHVNRRFRRHVIKRLDRQDEALGLPPLEEAAGEVPPPPRDPAPYPLLGNGSWYIVKDGHEEGPMPESSVIEKLRSGEVTGDTYVWSEGMQDWQRARATGNFHPYC